MAISESALRAVEAALGRWIGLDTSCLGGQSIERAVRGWLQASGLDDPAALVERGEREPSERDDLIEAVVIPESWFFRDPAVFDFLRSFAVTLAAIPARRPVRILSGPSASGEEPYSIAMCLFDAGLGKDDFSIDAIDVSSSAIRRARDGRYSANAFRNAEQSFRRRWFREVDGAAVIDEQVRRQVRFSRANLLDAGWAGGRRYDIVLCRNLLIYLTSDARRAVERNLDRLLADDGLLFLGAAEPPILQAGWIPAGHASTFALRRSRLWNKSAAAGCGVRRPPKTSAFGGVAQVEKGHGGLFPQAGSPCPTVQRPAATTGQRHRSPAAALRPAVRPAAVAAGKATANDRLEELLARVGSLANDGRHADALAECEASAREIGPAPELFFMMGMLHQAHGDLERAEGCFHKTLYLDPHHEEAALSLALVAGCRGDERMAESYRGTAARIFSRKAER